MALVCPNCGTDNPAGNTFCMSCGAALAAATTPVPDAPPLDLGGSLLAPGIPPDAPPPVDAAAGAPPASASFLPPGYLPPGASPYLPPLPAATVPPHRTPSTVIIAIVIAVLLVVAGGGVAFAALHKGGTTPAPSANIPVNVPTSAPTSAPTQPPASTPASTPAGSTGGQTVTAPFANIFVPTGYTVSDQEDDYVILTPNSGDDEAVGVQSEPLSETTTNAELDKELLQGDQQNDDPSAKLCSTKAPATAQLAGSGGAITADVISICENLTPPNGPAFAAVDAYIAGVAKAADGSLKAVWFEILAPASSFQAFTHSIPPALIAQTTFTDATPLT